MLKFSGFSLDNWFLPRYDLESVKLIVNKLKPLKNNAFSLLKIIIKDWKFLLFVLFSLFLFFTSVDYEKLPYYFQNMPLTNKSLITRQYDFRDLITFMWTTAAYLFIIIPVWKIVKNNLRIKLGSLVIPVVILYIVMTKQRKYNYYYGR